MFNRIRLSNQTKTQYDGLPIGNGRLAAIVTSDKSSDVLNLNHEWLWTGLQNDFEQKLKKGITDIKDLLIKGDYAQAVTYSKYYFGDNKEFGLNNNFYIPAGTLKVELSRSKLIKSELNLEDAVVSILRKSGRAKVKSEIFACSKTGLIMCRWVGNRIFSCGLSFTGLIPDPSFDCTDNTSIFGNTITYECNIKNGTTYKVIITLKTDGEIALHKNAFRVYNAFELEIYLNIFTDKSDPSNLRPPDKAWDELISEHKAEFSRFYNRVGLSVRLPFMHKAADPVLMFNLARYLLISSTINCELPPNSRGKWTMPQSRSTFGFNHVLHMQYSISQRANLAESAGLLIDYLSKHQEVWEQTARDIWSSRGIFVPEIMDINGRFASMCVRVGAPGWLCRIIMDYFEYTGDYTYLTDFAYPFLKESAMFYEDCLYEDKDGRLNIIPSQYPDDDPEIFSTHISMTSALDASLIYTTLKSAVKVGEILSVDADRRLIWNNILNKLSPARLDANGLLCEHLEENDASDSKSFRYLSLYSLVTSDILFSENRNNELDAALRTIDYYTAHDMSMSPVNAVRTALIYARTGCCDKAAALLGAVSRNNVLSGNYLFICDNELRTDLNILYGTAVSECLVSYSNGKVHLLRRLPGAWSKQGSLHGIRLPGGHTLNIVWKNGAVVSLDIIIGYTGEIVLSKFKSRFKIPIDYYDENGDILIKKKPGETFTISE